MLHSAIRLNIKKLVFLRQITLIPDLPLFAGSLHASGEMSCVLELGEDGEVVSSALLRTARKLMDGTVYV